MSSDPRETSPEQVTSETADQETTPASPQQSKSAASPSTSPTTSPSTSPSGSDAAKVPGPLSAEPPLRRMLKAAAGQEPAAPKPAAAPPEAGPTAYVDPTPSPEPVAQPPESQASKPADTGPSAGRRGPRDRKGKKSAPERPRVELPPRTVEPPSVRRPLSDDLEQQLESAFDGLSLDELVAPRPGSGEQLETETRLPGTVMKVHGDNVFFSLGGRNEGVASLRQFDEVPEVGVAMDIVINRFNNDDGIYEVSVPGASIKVQDWSDVIEGGVVEAMITGSNTGGLECTVGGLRGFIPASQIDVFHVDDMTDYHDQKLMCVVTEANERRGNLVLSHRARVEREKEEQRKKLLEELEVGDIREGTVTNIRPFGAFVDIGGVDGLVHISQLSWDRVDDPNEVLEVGQKVRVRVEKVDEQTGKIGLSYRDLLEHPWTNVQEQFVVDAVVRGVVTRCMDFGAFVKIAPGIEGLIHISELAHHRVVTVTNVVKEGEEVEVKILSIDTEAQRIGLSLKDAHPMPEVKKPLPAEEEAVDSEPPPKPIVPKHKGPLKGGTGRATGGEDFGLKW